MENIVFSSHRIKFTLTHSTKKTQWLNQIAKKENSLIKELSVIFCSDNHLLKINKQYLNHNTYTDIITFDYCPPIAKNQSKLLMGEIYISIHRIKENAKIFHASFETELNRVLAHGVLHLCGYKDKSVQDEKLMRKKEDYYLSLFGK